MISTFIVINGQQIEKIKADKWAQLDSGHIIFVTEEDGQNPIKVAIVIPTPGMIIKKVIPE